MLLIIERPSDLSCFLLHAWLPCVHVQWPIFDKILLVFIYILRHPPSSTTRTFYQNITGLTSGIHFLLLFFVCFDSLSGLLLLWFHFVFIIKKCALWTVYHQFLCPTEIQHFSESERKVFLYSVRYSSFAGLAATSYVKDCDSVLAIFNLSCPRCSSRLLV